MKSAPQKALKHPTKRPLTRGHNHLLKNEVTATPDPLQKRSKVLQKITTPRRTDSYLIL